VKNFCNRREFLREVSSGVCALSLSSGFTTIENLLNAGPAYGAEPPLKEVMFYKKLEDLRIECEICPRACKIADRERGYCGNKENRRGTYYTLVYAQACAVHNDPIEKKPLFHYLPGTNALSIAAAGCNFECKFCQNWQIAQFRPEQVDSYPLTPEQIVKMTKDQGSPTIAYTYSEPVVFYEYMYDTARLGRYQGVGSVMISNGYIKEEPLSELCKYLTGVKIDLKAFTEKFYRETCSGELKPVLDTLERLKKIGIWFEIVVLIVPTLNDSEKEIREMSRWIKEKLGGNVPVHFTRFHPMYKIKNLPPTPVSTLERARKIAQEAGIHYVYIGNVPGHEGEHTYCPSCKKIVIKRTGFFILENHVKGGKCSFCNYPIPGVWEKPPAIQKKLDKI
jgi:pyruvate formate lyase activating enzyme